MNRLLLQWSLFTTMVFTVPVIFFLLQIGLLIPLAAIVFYCFKMGGTGALILGGVHALIFGTLLWLVSRVLVRLMERIRSAMARAAAYFGVIACLVFMAWIGPYSIGGHANHQAYTWLQTFQIRH